MEKNQSMVLIIENYFQSQLENIMYYYLIHTKIRIDYILRQLKLNYANKIKGHHSFNNETCFLYNICDYSSNVTSTLEMDESENQILDETEN